jgi:hypothetical protein
MASNASILKATIKIADMDRHYYEDHALTLARHPSETDERMMVRLLTFVLHAYEALSFARGVSTEEEPALWHKDLTGAIVRWIEVGQPEEKTIRRTCGRAKQVCIYTYGGRGADQWWEKSGTDDGSTGSPSRAKSRDAPRSWHCVRRFCGLTSSPARGTGCTIIRPERSHASSITERPAS